MARYDFMCPKCRQVVEIERSIKDETSVLCCNEGCSCEMVQLISQTSFSLVGRGWASDGYGSKGNP